MSPASSEKESQGNLVDTARYAGIGAALTTVTNWLGQQLGAEAMTGEVMTALTVAYGYVIQWAWIKKKSSASRRRAEAKRKARLQSKESQTMPPEGDDK